jgi:hypothetical protein
VLLISGGPFCFSRFAEPITSRFVSRLRPGNDFCRATKEPDPQAAIDLP